MGRSWAVSAARADGTSSCRHLAKRHAESPASIGAVVPLTTNLERGNLAGTAIIEASDSGPAQRSVALAFQMRAVPHDCLESMIRVLSLDELAELELATDEAIGRLDPSQ